MSRLYSADQVSTCEDCAWRTAGVGSLGRAARHHDLTGHEVQTTSTVTYSRVPNADQTALDLDEATR